MTPVRSFLAALILGAASAFSFQPVGWWPLMILAMAALYELIARAGSLRQSLAIGWAFGVGQFCIGLNWIATAFTFQAAMPAWLGWIAVVLLSLYLAVYPMLAVGLAWRFGRKNKLAPVLALAGAWVITEWLRATMFTGSPASPGTRSAPYWWTPPGWPPVNGSALMPYPASSC
jgi:apolipoprotein N-acyltransferase